MTTTAGPADRGPAKAGRYLRLLAVNLLVFLLAAELLALTLFYWDTGNLFYLYQKPYDPIPETAQQRLTGDGLHPYFGPTHTPGHPFDIPETLRPEGSRVPARVTTNNFGFASAHDYPFARTDDRQFIVGMFGGSVGVWFCHVGAPTLLDRLSRDPRFSGRELVPLCFSHEGYKQPQQLQLLAYFLSIGQPFDLIVNIDGFNEVALGSINATRGIDISMPSAPHIEPLVNLVNSATLTPAKLQTLAAIARDKETLNRLIASMTNTRFAFVNFWLEQNYRIVRNRYQQALVTFGALPSNPATASLVQVTPPTRPRTDEQVFAEIATNWAEASALMHDLAAARGVPYVHLLQPNQYFTSRRFSDAEAAVAINTASSFKQGAERGYPRLLEPSLITRLRARGVRFVDGTHLFDTEPAPVYIDDCCHYTVRGYERLAEAIAGEVLKP